MSGPRRLGLAAFALTYALVGSGRASGPVPAFDRWESFTRASGLPSSRVFAVLADGTAVWAGTDQGLARVSDGAVVEVWGKEQGLPHPVVTSLARAPLGGDLWIGTMGGLARLSAGRIDRYTQLTSGLANDVVYGVATDGPLVWAATAAGLSSFDTRSGSWQIYDTSNTLMHEPWCYGVTAGESALYVAVWGGGIVIRDKASGRFRDHRDPDGEMEIDLFRDDGPIHDVTSSVGWGSGLLWQTSYFGVSRYDGRRWRTWTEKDSGLASSFAISVRPDGRAAWIGTDGGLSRVEGDDWVTWRRREEGGWERIETDASGRRRSVAIPSGPASNTIYGIDLDARGDLWLATAEGLSHGFAAGSAPAGEGRR